MGTVKVELQGTFEDISRIYEFMKLHTKGCSKGTWFGELAASEPSSVKFTAKL